MTQPLDQAFSPAFASPPHAVDDSGAIAAWFIEPAGALLQLTRPTRGTTALAEWLVGPAYARLAERFPDVQRFTIVLDMRQMTGRAATARSVLIEHAKLIAPRLGVVTLIPSLHLGPLYIKVLETTVAILRPCGIRVDIDQDLAHAMTRHAVRLAAEVGPDGATPTTRDPHAGRGRAQL